MAPNIILQYLILQNGRKFKMSKTTVILVISLLICQACNEEKLIPERIKSNKEEIKKRFCYLLDIKKNVNSATAVIDFIEYQKITELDSNMLLSQFIELPNGFSYSNKEVKIEEVELKNSSKIIMQTFSYSKEGNFNFNEAVTFDEFVKECNTTEPKPFMFSPYKIVLNKSNIIALTEIYIP